MEILNDVLDSIEKYVDDSGYQYSDFESESETNTGEKGPGWDIRIHQGVKVHRVKNNNVIIII